MGSSEQLERLLKILLSIQLPSNPRSRRELRPEHLLMEIFHSAQFWELPNIRSKLQNDYFVKQICSNFNLDVFLGLLHKMTSEFETTSPEAVDVAASLARVSIYRRLLLFPMEYFSWHLLNDLIKRAVVTDTVLCQVNSGHDQCAIEGLITLRVFLKRAYLYSGSVAQDSVRLSRLPIIMSV